MEGDSRLEVKEGDIIYRPLHALPGFRIDGESWVAKYLNDRSHPHEVSLDLLLAMSPSCTWSSLGFPAFDALKPTTRESDVQALVKAGLRVTLSYTGIGSYQVVRGLWWV